MLIGFRGLVIQTGRERLRKESGLKLNEKATLYCGLFFYVYNSGDKRHSVLRISQWLIIG